MSGSEGVTIPERDNDGSREGWDALFEHAFESTPISIWIEDWSEVRREVQRLRERGITDITAHLLEHPDLVRELDKGMEVLAFNDAAVTMLGAPDKAAVWDNMDDLSIGGGDRLRIYAEIIGAFAEGQIKTVSEGWISTYGERQIYARDTAAIAPDRLDDWGRMVHTIEDITEQHRAVQRLAEQNATLAEAAEEREWAEAALSESERRFSDAAQTAHLGHYVWDKMNGRLVYSSPEYAAIHGMTIEEMMASAADRAGDIALVHPDDRDVYLAIEPQGTASEEPRVEGEYRIIRPDGEVRLLHEICNFEFDADGNAVRSVGTVQDITERERAESKLHESEQRLSDAARLARLGYYSWNRDLEQPTVVSEEYARIFGSTPEDCAARHAVMETYISEDVHADDRERYRATAVDGLTADSPAYEIEYRIVRHDGEIRHVVESSHTEFDRDGNIGVSFGILLDITERKRTESLLEKREEQLRQAVEITRVGHYVWDDVSGRLLDCSPEYAAIYGMTVDEVFETIADSAGDLAAVHPDDREKYLTGPLWNVTPGAPRAEDTYRIVRSDGEVRQLHEIAVHEFDRNGQTVRATGTIQDVTEVKRAEEALRESEERYADAARVGRLGHFGWDESEDRLAYCSEEFARIHGLSIEEYEKKFGSAETDADRVHPDDRERYRNEVVGPVHGRPSYAIDYRIVRPDGEVRHVHEFSRAIYNDEGRPVISRGIVQDITAQALAEEARRESEERFRGIVANVPDIIYRCATDENWTIEFINDAVEEITGFPASDFLDGIRSFPSIQHPGDAEKFSELVLEATRTGTPFTSDYRIVCADGSVRYIHETGRCVFGSDGEVEHIDGVMTDVTEQKAVEEGVRERDRLLALAQQGAKLGYWRWRKADDRILALSDEFRRIYGVSDDVKLDAFADTYEFIHPDDRRWIVQRDEQNLADLQDYSHEFRVVQPGGEVVHVIEHGTVEHDAAGNAVGYIGTLQDATELKRAEAQLAEKEAQLRRTVRIARIGHYVWDEVSQRLVDCSPEYAAIHGLTVAKILDKRADKESIAAMVHPEDRADFLDNDMWDPTPDAPRTELTYRIVRTDGEIRHLHEISEAEIDGAGNRVRAVGTVQDITELKRAEEAMRESEERYADAARVGHLGHFEWDEVNNRLAHCSTEFAAIHGLSVQEYHDKWGAPDADVERVHPDDRERYAKEVVGSRDKPSYNVDYRILLPDGTVRHVHETARTRYDREGRPVVSHGVVQDVTERVQAELALRENQRLLTVAQHTAKLGYWVWNDAEQRVTTASENFRQIWDLDEDVEVTDFSSTHHRLHPDDLEELKAIDEAQRKTPRDYTHQFRIVRRDGEVTHVVEQVRAQYGRDGEPIGYIGTIQDISELKLAEEALRENEKLFRSIVESVPGVVYRRAADKDWTDEYISDYVGQLTGYPASDFIDGAVRTRPEITHPDDREKVERAVSGALAEKRPFAVDYRLRHVDGSIRYVEEMGRGVYGSDGDLKYLAGTVVDATQKTKAAMALQESEDRFRTLVSNLPGAVFRGDFQNDVMVYFSEGFEALTGVPIDELVGGPNMKAFDFIFEEDKPRMEAALAKIESTSKPLILDYRIRHRDGSIRWVLEMSTPTRDAASGNLRWLDGIILDVTDKKEIEAQLVEAKHDAEQASVAKSEFLAKVSHDLRTPVNAVKLYSELLHEDLTDLGRDELVGDVEKILYAASHQLDLINDLLDMAKIEAGELVLADTDFELAGVTDACLDMVRDQAEAGGIALESSSLDPALRLRADQPKLKQILINLLSNAIKFTPQGGTVRLDVLDGMRGGIRLRVSDTGVGMAPEDVPKALEKFGQIEGHGPQRFMGTGLGLPIAQSLIAAHGGVLEIESVLGEGTAVTVTLPPERVLGARDNAAPAPGVNVA